MKQINLIINKYFLLIIISLLCTSLTSQDYQIEKENTYCGDDKGSFHFTFESNIYVPPIQLEYENETTGEFYETEINSYNFTLSQLTAGDYIFNFIIDEEHIYEICDEISDENPFSIDDFNIEIENCANNGKLKIEIINSEIVPFALPYQLQIFGLNSLYSNSLNVENETFEVDNIPEADYAIKLIFSDGCELNDEFSILFNQIEIQFESTPACNFDGSIQTLVSNGLPPYTYIWTDDNNEVSPNRTGLGSNLYTVIVTDGNGCTNAASVYIKNVDPIALDDMEYAIYNASCNVDDGTINIYTPPSGGSGQFSYEWSNGESGQNHANNGNTLYDLNGGNYQVTISDIEGCSAFADFMVLVEGLPEVEINTIEHTCEGEANGIISLKDSDYSINWSNGEVGSLITNLSSGVYSYTATDNSNGCSIEESVEIEILDLNSSPILANLESYTNCASSIIDNGKIILSVSGGISPYSYNWSNGKTSKNIMNIGKGDYSVTITDKCGLTGMFSTYVDATEVLANSNWELNFGEISINTNPDGGEAPYTFLWGNGESTQNISVSDQGIYNVTITDVNGCEGLESINISYNCEPLSIVLDGTSEGFDCNDPIILRFDATPGNIFLEGTAPFNVKIEKLVEQEWILLQNLVFNSIYELSLFVYSSSTNGTYRASVIDNCGDKFEAVHEGCLDCNYEFYNENDEVYVDLFQGMVTLEQVCPCSNDCDWGFTHDKIKLFVDEDEIMNSNLPWNLFNFKIIWPKDENGEIEETVITKSWIGDQQKIKVQGPTEYVLSTDEYNSGGISISVEYNLVQNNTQVLQCEAIIPFEFGKLGYNGYFSVFEIDEGYFNPFPQYGSVFNIGTVACSTACRIPLVTGELYVNEPADFDEQDDFGSMCVESLDETLIFFRYVPHNYDYPCSGGTLESHFETEDGIVKLLKSIPAGVSLGQFSSTFPLFSDGSAFSQYTCNSDEINKGYCLFDAMDVYGIALNHKLLVEYCESFNYTPPIDSDGDGLPNDIDPCDFNPDVFCDEDDEGGDGSVGGGNVDENGCVTNFHSDECQLSIVCPDEEVEYIAGDIQEETHSGFDPCAFCFSADICRVTNPNTGQEFSSPVGSALSIIQVNIVDDPDCESNCAIQYTCEITGESLGTKCAPGCSLATAWDYFCDHDDFADIISFQTNDDGSMNIQTRLSEEQVLKIITQESSQINTSTLDLYTIPNPSSSHFGIKIHTPYSFNSEISIKNILGELLYSNDIILDSGVNEISVDHSFSSGVYYISIIDFYGNLKSTKHIVYGN